MPQHIAIAALRSLGQRTWRRAVEGLGIQLLVAFIDEHHPVAAKAEAATAIFIDPAARTETVGRQAMGLFVTPVPEAAGTIGGAELVPEQAGGADLEFGEVGAGSHGLGSTEISLGQ